jgi:hypothetical protein
MGRGRDWPLVSIAVLPGRHGLERLEEREVLASAPPLTNGGDALGGPETRNLTLLLDQRISKWTLGHFRTALSIRMIGYFEFEPNIVIQ